jgi:hypothetical protein
VDKELGRHPSFFGTLVRAMSFLTCPINVNGKKEVSDIYSRELEY